MMVDISELFQDSSNTPASPSTHVQTLSRLDAEEETVYYVLAGREGAGFQLTVCTGTEAWTTHLTETDLSSMATTIGIETEEFTGEMERALTGQPLNSERFAYSVCRKNEGLQVTWKRHLANSVKFKLGHTVLRQEQAGPVLQSVLDHAVHSIHSLQNRITQLENENMQLIQERQTALEKYEQCVSLKQQLEVELYGKFVAVLNEKKDKIRQLIEELRSQQPQSAAGEGGDKEDTEQTMVQVEKAAVHTPSHEMPASSGLLGGPQEVVSPPVKRRKREPRQKAAKGSNIPYPPSISRPVTSEAPHRSSSPEGDDLLQLL